jgi:hypothetical protein
MREFRVQDSGFRILTSEFRIQDSDIRSETIIAVLTPIKHLPQTHAAICNLQSKICNRLRPINR